jgi:hypothetical protein
MNEGCNQPWGQSRHLQETGVAVPSRTDPWATGQCGTHKIDLTSNCTAVVTCSTAVTLPYLWCRCCSTVVVCQAYMQICFKAPAVTLAVGSLRMLARALHLHRVSTSFSPSDHNIKLRAEVQVLRNHFRSIYREKERCLQSLGTFVYKSLSGPSVSLWFLFASLYKRSHVLLGLACSSMHCLCRATCYTASA